MNDRNFLMWLHERLVSVHGENACFDYMHKLRAIIKATPADKITPGIVTGDSLDDLRMNSPDAGGRMPGAGGTAHPRDFCIVDPEAF